MPATLTTPLNSREYVVNAERRSTSRTVTAVIAERPIWAERASSFRVLCDTHGTTRRAANRTEAFDMARYPASFCDQCTGPTARRQRVSRAARRVTGTVAAVAGNRKFGVEIEFIGAAMSRVAQELRNRGLGCDLPGYSHRVLSTWKVVSDASLPSGGGELVSPPLRGAAGLEQLRLACEALEAAGARVSRSCGLHVHHDVNGLNAPALGRLFRNWMDTQSATDQLVSASRRGTRWAAPLTHRDVERVESLRSTARDAVRSHFAYVDRYRSLNVAAYPRYGTVEVRQHQGTISFTKIAAWVAYGQAQINAAVAGVTLASVTAHDLLDTLAAHGLSADQVTYLKQRAGHFGFAAPAPAPVAA